METCLQPQVSWHLIDDNHQAENERLVCHTPMKWDSDNQHCYYIYIYIYIYIYNDK